MLINELKLLLGLASRSLEVESSSLSVAACIGPGTLCAQGLARTLTGSVTFRLFQHGPQKPLCHKVLTSCLAMVVVCTLD